MLREILNTWDNADSELNKKIDNTNLSSIVASATASATNSKTVEINGTGKNLEKLMVEGKTEQNGTPSPSNPVEVKGVGDYDEETGKYKIPISVGDTTKNVYLDAPLFDGEKADVVSGVAYNSNGSIKETFFDGVEISTVVGKNTLTVDTEVTPVGIEATTFGDYYSKAEVDKKISEIESDVRPLTKKRYVSNNGATVLRYAFDRIYSGQTTLKTFFVEISMKDDSYYIGYYIYKPNTEPVAIEISKSGITSVNKNIGGTLAPVGGTGTPTFNIIGIS